MRTVGRLITITETETSSPDQIKLSVLSHVGFREVSLKCTRKCNRTQLVISTKTPRLNMAIAVTMAAVAALVDDDGGNEEDGTTLWRR